MPAVAHVVVIEHVAEAAVDHGGPRRGRLAAEAPEGGFFPAAEVAHVLVHQCGFFVDAAGANGDTQRVEHALLGEFEEFAWYGLVTQSGGVAREFAGGVFAGGCFCGYGGFEYATHEKLQ